MDTLLAYALSGNTLCVCFVSLEMLSGSFRCASQWSESERALVPIFFLTCC